MPKIPNKTDATKNAAIVAAMKKTLGNMSEAAKLLGCARSTISDRARRFPDLAEALAEVNEEVFDFVESALLKKVREGDTTAIIFACKTKLRSRGYVEGAIPMAQSAIGKFDEQPTIERIRAYLDYVSADGQNLTFVYGTTRSGKTYTILQWLVAGLRSGRLGNHILVGGMTMPFLRNGAMAYLRTICRDYSDCEVIDGGRKVRCADREIICQSFDDPAKALSAQWSTVYLNEGNYLPTSVVDALRIRTAGLIVCDYNPSVAKWWGSEKNEEKNTLFCSFTNNPFLGDAQKEAIEDIKRRGETAPVGSYENWYYNVYYLGRYAEMGGGVFTNVRRCTPADVDAVEAVEAWGIDFGDVADPNALVRVRVIPSERRLFCECRLYRTAVDDVEMVEILNREGVGRLVCETATGGQTRMRNFKKLGFKGWVIPCEKEQVAQSVFNLSGYEINCADDHTFEEFRDYTIADGRFHGDDHCIDAVRYVAHKLINGSIRET